MYPWSLEIHTNLADFSHETEKMLSKMMVTIFFPFPRKFKYMLQFLCLDDAVANYN